MIQIILNIIEGNPGISSTQETVRYITAVPSILFM